MNKLIMAMAVILTMMFAVSAFADNGEGDESAGSKYYCRIVSINEYKEISEKYLHNVSLEDVKEELMVSRLSNGIVHTKNGAAEYACSNQKKSYDNPSEYTETVIHGEINYRDGDMSTKESVCQRYIGKHKLGYNFERYMTFPDDNKRCFDFLNPGWEKEAKVRILESFNTMLRRAKNAEREIFGNSIDNKYMK